MPGRNFSSLPCSVGVVSPSTFLTLYLVLIPVAGGVIEQVSFVHKNARGEELGVCVGGGAGKLVMERKRLARGLEEIRWPQQSLRLPAEPVLTSAGKSSSAQRYAPVGPAACDLADRSRLSKNGCQRLEERCLAPVLRFQGSALTTLSLSLCFPS